MIRVFQRTMHGRAGPKVESRDVRGLELAAIVPLVAVIVALGVYPNFVVAAHRAGDRRAHRPGASGGRGAGPSRGRR